MNHSSFCKQLKERNAVSNLRPETDYVIHSGIQPEGNVSRQIVQRNCASPWLHNRYAWRTYVPRFTIL